MALIYGDRVLETSTTTGTGALTLAAAITGYQRFSAVCSVADTVYYGIFAVDANGNPSGDWEAGLGTYSSANTLTRTSVTSSSNANAAVNFGAGTKWVLASPTAASFAAVTTYTDEMARDAIGAAVTDSTTIDATYNDGADTITLDVIRSALKPTETLLVAVGDETTAITTGTAKVTFRMPYAFTVTAVRASLTTVSSSGIPTVDINEAGTTILSTKLTIDASEKTSTTAATAAVISDTSLADDAEMTIDIDVAGTGAAGLKVYIIGYRT